MAGQSPAQKASRVQDMAMSAFWPVDSGFSGIAA
jgi:hypothetical protein